MSCTSGTYFVRLNASPPNTHAGGSPRLGEVSATRALDFRGLCRGEAERGGGRPQCEARNSERPSAPPLRRRGAGTEVPWRSGGRTQRPPRPRAEVSGGRDRTRAGGSSGCRVHCLPGDDAEKMRDTRLGESDSDQVSVQAPLAREQDARRLHTRLAPQSRRRPAAETLSSASSRGTVRGWRSKRRALGQLAVGLE